jgi:hypothetical protein
VPLTHSWDAQRWDRERLRVFRASGSGAHVEEVNGCVASVLSWREDAPNRVVRLYSDGDDAVAGVLAYEVLLEPGVLVFVALLAVEQSRGRRGYGTEIALGLWRFLEQTHPGCRIAFRVAPSNLPMHAMCMKWRMGEPIYDGDYCLYEGDLPESLPCVP